MRPPLLPRWHPATLRAALWTVRAIRSARTSYARGDLSTEGNHRPPSLPPVPAVPDGAVRGVRAVLRRANARCLVSATVRQAWDDAHGRQRDLVIGVTAPQAGFKAHAWLDGDPPCYAEGFEELVRLTMTGT